VRSNGCGSSFANYLAASSSGAGRRAERLGSFNYQDRGVVRLLPRPRVDNNEDPVPSQRDSVAGTPVRDGGIECRCVGRLPVLVSAGAERQGERIAGPG
jgi:hypothetical protein